MKCDDLARREAVLAHPTLNGIDYIEVPKDSQQNIRVYFIKADNFSDIPDLTLDQIQIEGGVRIKNIKVKSLQKKTDADSNPYLEVHVDKAGDFSTYVLIIDSPSQVDIGFSRHPFSFKAGCPSDFDCQAKVVCPPESRDEPVIDYLAKDYASFRRALLDLISTRIPDWQETHEADLGITITELLAYVGDQLSYHQDSVANETYLETARQRESVKRHARLIDYNMHDGANARAFVHIQAANGSTGTIPAGTSMLSRIDVPIGTGKMPPYGPEFDHTEKDQALTASDVIFETVEEIDIDAKLNEIKIYTWGNRLCCVPRGETSIYLEGELPLEEGDLLLFEEVKGSENGLSADADPKHRQIVRLVEVKKTTDPLENDPDTGVPPMNLTMVTWSRFDALTFPLCLSSRQDDGTYIDDISVARGNLVLADHGETLEEWYPADPHAVPFIPGVKQGNIAYRFELSGGPVTFHSPLYSNDQDKPSVQQMLEVDPHRAIAHIYLENYEKPSDTLTNKHTDWEVVPHLLDSNSFHRHFVVESRNNGKAIVRFGDGESGLTPPEESYFNAIYRVGNGTSGNVGSDTIVHIVKRDLSDPAMIGKIWPEIKAIRNPLPAWGGIEPETIDQVKLLAPKAFHAEQFRAVTEDDYAKAAEKHSLVSKAAATFRWTGSWHTVFLTIDPLGRMGLTPELEASVRSHISRYKLAGYDIEIDPPIYVPLEIEINVCAALDHFKAHVKEAVLDTLSSRKLINNQNGFFHPDNFTFKQPVYLSRLYEAIEQIDGVDSSEVIVFKRFGKVEHDELEQGYIPMGRLEIARLDNDPNFPENGVLLLNMMGGK